MESKFLVHQVGLILEKDFVFQTCFITSISLSFLCSYEEALSKLKQALKTESQVTSLLNKVKRQMCHCHLKVNSLSVFAQ